MIFFRIGSYLLLITGVLHFIGQTQGMTPQNETEQQVFDMMATKMNIGSETVTMMGLFNGFDWFFTLLWFWTGALSLVLSYKLKNHAALKTVSLINAISLALGVVLCLLYFFSIPTICLSLCFLAFAVSTWRLRASHERI